MGDHGRFEARWTENGRSRRVSLKTADREEAERRAPFALKEVFGIGRGMKDLNADRRTWMSHIRARMRTCRNNSKKRGRPFTIAADQVFAMLVAQEYRCAVSGVPMEPVSGSGKRNPWGMSIDRIDGSKGYEPGNIRLVCAMVNYAMNEWGSGPFLTLIHYARVPAKRPV